MSWHSPFNVYLHVQVEEVLVEARSRDIHLDDGDYFKIIVALCNNKMAAQAKVWPYFQSFNSFSR